MPACWSALSGPSDLPSSAAPQLLLDTWVIRPSGCQARAVADASSDVGPAMRRRPISIASGATPVTPMLLKPLAAAKPAHLVPCESLAWSGDGSLDGTSLQFR